MPGMLALGRQPLRPSTQDDARSRMSTEEIVYDDDATVSSTGTTHLTRYESDETSVHSHGSTKHKRAHKRTKSGGNAKGNAKGNADSPKSLHVCARGEHTEEECEMWDVKRLSDPVRDS